MVVLAAVFALMPQSLPSLGGYELYHHATWRTLGHKWEFKVFWLRDGSNDDRNQELDKLNLVYLDGKVVKRIANEGLRRPWEPQQLYLAAEPIRIRSPYEAVVAIRGAWGLGSHWDTVFYGCSGPRMVLIGRAPANMSNGPLQYGSGHSKWLFDDYDRYEAMRGGSGVTKHLVFQIRKGRPMRLIGTIRSKKPISRVLSIHEE